MLTSIIEDKFVQIANLTSIIYQTKPQNPCIKNNTNNPNKYV